MKTDQYKEVLAKELAVLEEELQAIAVLENGDWKAKQTDSEVNESDDLDKGADNEQLYENGGILVDLELRWRAVRRALERIEAGTYGICERCGGEISPARLEANAAAATCVKCM